MWELLSFRPDWLYFYKMPHNPVSMKLWYYYLFRVSFTACICFNFGGETFHRILNDQEIHNWTERIKEKITCSSTIELEVLIQPKFHLDKEQKNLLQENDEEESSFFDVDDISKVEDGARLSYCNFW